VERWALEHLCSLLEPMSDGAMPDWLWQAVKRCCHAFPVNTIVSEMQYN